MTRIVERCERARAPMRILTVSNLYPPVVEGGYEARCAATMDRLREEHEIFVLTSTRRRHECPDDPAVRRELPLLPYGKVSTLRAPLAAAKGIEAMRRALSEVEPDLIFVWNGSHIPHAALRVAEQSGTAIAYSVGEHWLGRIYRSDAFTRYLLPGQRGPRAAWAPIPRLLNRLPPLQVDLSEPARAAICWNSKATRRACGVPSTLKPTLEATIYPAVPEPERWIGLERRPSPEPSIVFIGRVEEEKGPHVAYRALAHLRDVHGIRARLLLAGPVDPAMESVLSGLAAQLGIAEQVQLLGRLDKTQLGELLQQAHALVAPSTWEEPFGLVLLEAALARVPVVASRSGGMPEALQEGAQALFFRNGDAPACADALAASLDHSSSSEARVRAAFERARDLSFDRYMAEMGQFVVEARASFDTSNRSLGSPV